MNNNNNKDISFLYEGFSELQSFSFYQKQYTRFLDTLSAFSASITINITSCMTVQDSWFCSADSVQRSHSIVSVAPQLQEDLHLHVLSCDADTGWVFLGTRCCLQGMQAAL